MQEHLIISLDKQTRVSQSELRPGRVLSRQDKTSDGSKRSKESSGSLRTTQRMSNGEDKVEKDGEEAEDEVEEEPRTMRKSKKGVATARGERRGRRTRGSG